MHVFSKYNVKTPENKFTSNKILFSIFEFVLSPSLVVGLGAYYLYKELSLQSDIYFPWGHRAHTVLVSYHVFVLCLDTRPEELRKI